MGKRVAGLPLDTYWEIEDVDASCRSFGNQCTDRCMYWWTGIGLLR